MSRPNDIGGLTGFGPIEVEPEADEKVFHADWEKRLFGMILATSGNWTIDMFKAARERDDRVEYMRRSYFENFLVGFDRVVAESGLLRTEGPPVTEAAARQGIRASSVTGGPQVTFLPRPDTSKPARFKVGETVRGVDHEPDGHTRRPGYVQGRTGVVVAHHGAHRFPDRSAEGVIEGQHLYTVSFDAHELWGDRADGADVVYVDLFDDYLEPVR